MQIESNIYTFSDDGKFCYFGSYPQDMVVDEDLIDTLDATHPIDTSWIRLRTKYWDNKFFQKDVVYNDVKYRGFHMTGFRLPSNGEEMYVKAKTYWFRYDPIKWRVLEKEDGKAMLFSDKILDRRAFTFSRGYDETEEYVEEPNSYEYSDVRRWLNAEFCSCAFDDKQADAIVPVNVIFVYVEDNPKSMEYVQKHCMDKVFLLSVSEVCLKQYGFELDDDALDRAKMLPVTDYATCMKVMTITKEDVEKHPDLQDFVGNGLWLTRSAYGASETQVYAVTQCGSLKEIDHSFECVGVAPAVVIKLDR